MKHLILSFTLSLLSYGIPVIPVQCKDAPPPKAEKPGHFEDDTCPERPRRGSGRRC